MGLEKSTIKNVIKISSFLWNNIFQQKLHGQNFSEQSCSLLFQPVYFFFQSFCGLKFSRRLSSSVKWHKSANTEQKEEGRECENGLLRSMKKTCNYNPNWKLMQGYIFLSLAVIFWVTFLFHACFLKFSCKVCSRELNFSFCEIWLCLWFSYRCSAQQGGLVGSVALYPQNVTSMQLSRNIWIAWLESILDVNFFL